MANGETTEEPLLECAWVSWLPQGAENKTTAYVAGPPGFLAVDWRIADLVVHGLWSWEGIWLLWALFPPVVKAGLCDKTARPGERAQVQISWSRHLPMHFSFTFMAYIYWGGGICGCTGHQCIKVRGQLGGTDSFQVGSRDQTQAIRYLSKCTVGLS